MAFKREDVIAALENEDTKGLSTHAAFTANFNTIVDYLTGASASLQNIQNDYSSASFNGIIKLIKDAANPDGNDQLAQDVILHPDMIQHLGYHYQYHLFQLFAKTDNGGFLKAVVDFFKRFGYSDKEAFSAVLQHVTGYWYYEGDTVVKLLHSPALQQYFSDYLTKAPINDIKAIYTTGYYHWQVPLFDLLDRYRPEAAPDYLEWALENDRYTTQTMITHVKDNVTYINVVERFLKENKKEPELIYQQLPAALSLYIVDKTKYRNTGIALAKRYLDFFIERRSDQQWEQTINLTGFFSDRNIPMSAMALAVLFEEDKEAARNYVLQLTEEGFFINTTIMGIVAKEDVSLSKKLFDNAFSSKIGGINYYLDVLELCKKYLKPDEYVEKVWLLITHKSKPLRTRVAGILAEDDAEAEVKAIKLLEHKSADARQTAALILGYFPGEVSAAAIKKVLDKEKNDTARDILLQSVAEGLPATGNRDFLEKMIEAAAGRGKLDKPVEAWLNEAELPGLKFNDGTDLSAETIRFLLYRMSRVKAMQSDIEARYVLALIDREEAAAFAQQLIQLYKTKGAKPEHKYLMALAALLGNDAVVDKIRTTINNWIEENRYKMAEYGVGALALQGGDKALRWVEWYSRKYRSKKANVGTAALAALETAAEELNITIHELGDRIVPDFGFEGLFKEFEINGDQYRAFIDGNFKIAYFNEDDKKLKSLPAAASKELKDEFKDIAKEVRDVVKSQSSRMEYYLIIQRKWTAEQWQQFFMNNPVMFIYATKMLWGTYNAEGEILDTFIVSDDTSLLNVEEEEYDLPEDAVVGMVHPTQLNPDLLQQWKQVFFDRAIDPVFLQLERAKVDLTKLDMDKAIITTYEGKRTATGSIRSTLEKFGWHKGSIGDGGMVESFNLLYHERKIEAVLDVEGIGAGYGWGGDEGLGRLYFVNKDVAPGKWIGYIKNDNDEKLVKLKDIPPIFLSEVIAAIESIRPVEEKTERVN